MTSLEILALIITILGVVSFSTVFTVLYLSYSSSAINEINSGKKDIELIDEMIYERQENVKRRRKFINIIRSVFFYALLIIIIPIFVFSFINKLQGQTTMIGKHTIMVVASGSMSEKNEANDYLLTNNLDNQFQTHDIIVLGKVNDSSELKLYDVIAYVNDKGINIIHRIIEIEHNADGSVSYVTRGDANNETDSYHPTFNDVIGKYTDKRFKTIGIFVMFFQSYPGIITICSLIYCLFMVDRISNKMIKIQNKRAEHLSGIIEQISDNDNVKEIKTSYKEVIYYKGFAYYFDETGFINKEPVTDEVIISKTENTLIKVKENDDSTKTINEIVVDEQKGESKNEK